MKHILLITALLMVSCISNHEVQDPWSEGRQKRIDSPAVDLIGWWKPVGSSIIEVYVEWHTADNVPQDTATGLLKFEIGSTTYPYIYVGDTLTIKTQTSNSKLIRIKNL